MKAVYTKAIEMTFYMRDGTEATTGSDYCSGRSYYIYDEVPDNTEVTYDVYGVLREDTKRAIGRFPFVDNIRKSKFSNKSYLNIKQWYGWQKLCINDIDFIVLREIYTVHDNPKIEWLEKDLGFKGYSELVFDREQELKNLLLKG